MGVVKSFTYKNRVISDGGQDEISVTIAKNVSNDQWMTISFGKNGMDPETVAVSGSAITFGGDYSLFSKVDINPNGENMMLLNLVFENNLPEGNYTAEIPAGYFTVRSASGSKQLYTNKKVTINVEVITVTNLVKPEIKIIDDKVTWNPVEGARYYEVIYCEDGVDKKGFDFHQGEDYLYAGKNFPYQSGKKYSVKVIAYPVITSTTGAEAELLYKEMGEQRAAAPKQSDIKFEYSSVSKINTVLKIESDNKNIEYFVRLFADDAQEPFMTYRRGRYNGFDLSSWLSKQNIKDVFYVEVCAVDLSKPDLAASEWVRSKGQSLDTQENLLSNITDNMTEEQFEEVVNKLFENGKDIDDLNQLLLNRTKDDVREGYTKLEQAVRNTKNVSIENKLNHLINGEITTAGLALNFDKDTKSKLQIEEPANKISIPDGYHASSAVHMDISAEPKLEKLEYPVMITMPIPKGLNVNKKIVIFHEGEKEPIYPIVNKEANTLTFSVTHFSSFVFANQEDSASVLPTRPTYRPSSSGSSGTSSTSSAAVNALQTNGKPGVWAKNATGRWFSFTDKTYPASQWLQVSGKWYYFDESGYVSTGWKMVDGKWYYMDAENGDMAEGWKSINGKWYFLNPADGNMAEGWKIIDGKWYYLNPVNGDMAEGWKMVDSRWYYLNPVNGDMATGKTQINGKWYYLTENGDCLISTVTPDGGKADADGVVFYGETR